MRKVAYAAALRVACGLVILDQATGRLGPFEVNDEQRRVLRAILDHDLVIILKGRQVGVSTICCLYDLLFAAANPGVSVAIIADVHEKAIGLLDKCRRWARKAGYPLLIDNERKLVLGNGSEIVAITANKPDTGSDESTVGRSATYALLHFSELAFYNRDRAVWAALTSTALPNAKIIVESTATPAENLFRAIWGSVEGWFHVFLSIEEHDVYQRDPLELTDEQWEALQSDQGFTSRAHAAWWHHQVRTKLVGDVHRGLREYPVRPEHAFAFAEGRWIMAYTPAEPRIDGAWSFYVDPEAFPEPAVLGVDTAKGVGLDASAIVARGQRTGRMLATWKDNKTSIPAFTDVVKAAVRRWKPVAVVIESNGVGCSVYQEVSETVWETVEQKSSENNGEKNVRMTKVKHDIETGALIAGPELQNEVKHSMVTKKGGYEGPDDLLNAASFAGKWIDENPWKPKALDVDSTTTVTVAKVLAGRGRKVIY